MIKIVLKNGESLLYDGSFSGVGHLFDKMHYQVSSDGWLKLGDYILPANQIMYIKNIEDDNDAD